MLPPGVVIQCALSPDELPAHIAKQIGCMYLKRYKPSPVRGAQQGFKDGSWRGCLSWALREDGKVLGWAIRATPPGKTSKEVMVFVRAPNRRQGLGDAMLDMCLKHAPGPVTYYPHDPTAQAFYRYRSKKLGGGS